MMEGSLFFFSLVFVTFFNPSLTLSEGHKAKHLSTKYDGFKEKTVWKVKGSSACLRENTMNIMNVE